MPRPDSSESLTIEEGLRDAKDERPEHPDEAHLRTLTEDELLREHAKYAESIRDRRAEFEAHEKEALAEDKNPGTYIGDCKGAKSMIGIIETLLEEQGVPFEKFK